MITQEALQEALNRSFARDTAGIPRLWTPENPAYSHCTTASLIAQEFRGGTFVTFYIPGEWQDELGYDGHVLNRTPQGDEDYTRSQFPENFPYIMFLYGSEFSRARYEYFSVRDFKEDFFSIPGVPLKYHLLKARVNKHLNLELPKVADLAKDLVVGRLQALKREVNR